MLKLELRQKFWSNGLIDDVVVFGLPEDYVHFSEAVAAAIVSPQPVVLRTDTHVCVEITRNDNIDTLFTSLQNQSDEYFSMDAWNARSILRVLASERTLLKLSTYLLAVAGRGIGYSYISEFTEPGQYSDQSPEWRLHIQSEANTGI